MAFLSEKLPASKDFNNTMGDWWCPPCHIHRFDRTYQCKRCGYPQEDFKPHCLVPRDKNESWCPVCFPRPAHVEPFDRRKCTKCNYPETLGPRLFYLKMAMHKNSIGKKIEIYIAETPPYEKEGEHGVRTLGTFAGMEALRSAKIFDALPEDLVKDLLTPIPLYYLE